MSGRRVVLVLIVCALALACGQKKIEGPVAESGEVVLRVLYLVDQDLPALSDEDIRRALEISEKQIESRTGRDVRFVLSLRADLQTEFDRMAAPFGKIVFAPRLDVTKPLSDESTRILYARMMDLLRSSKLRPIFPNLSLPPDFPDISVILDTAAKQFDASLETLRRSKLLSLPKFRSASSTDRRSIFAWYTVLGALSSDSKPADVILTNDLLIFDSISSMPPQSIVFGGLALSYARVYPGVALVSTLPFLSDDPWFAGFMGTQNPAERLTLLSWSISREVGGKLIRMEQEELDHAVCLHQVLIPPFARSVREMSTAVRCPKDHKPLDRRQLLSDYLVGFARISVIQDRPADAERAFRRLREIMPDHPALSALEKSLAAVVKSPS